MEANKFNPWEKMNMSEGYEGWISSRLMADGYCHIIYEVIGNEKEGYMGFASNNAYGFEREAVRREGQKKGAHYKDPYKLMKRIENGSQLWLCTGHCNCVGEYTKTIDE